MASVAARTARSPSALPSDNELRSVRARVPSTQVSPGDRPKGAGSDDRFGDRGGVGRDDAGRLLRPGRDRRLRRSGTHVPSTAQSYVSCAFSDASVSLAPPPTGLLLVHLDTLRRHDQHARVRGRAAARPLVLGAWPQAPSALELARRRRGRDHPGFVAAWRSSSSPNERARCASVGVESASPPKGFAPPSAAVRKAFRYGSRRCHEGPADWRKGNPRCGACVRLSFRLSPLVALCSVSP